MVDKKNNDKEHTEILLNNYNYALNEEFDYLDKKDKNGFSEMTNKNIQEEIKNINTSPEKTKKLQ